MSGTSRSTRLRAGFCGWLLLALLAGCAQLVPQTIALRTGWPQGVAQTVELTSVPFFPQVDYQCGPAALATVMSYTGVPVTPEPLVSQVFLPSRQGSLQIEMLATPRRYGRIAYPLAPRYGDLLREVAAGNPVIVLQDVGLMFTQWHYAVVNGFDYPSGTLWLRSGTQAAPGDAVHRFRAQLDEERVLGDGGDTARPHTGHRDGGRLDVGRARDGAGRPRQTRQRGPMPPPSSAGPTTCPRPSGWPTSTTRAGRSPTRRRCCARPGSGTRSRRSSSTTWRRRSRIRAAMPRRSRRSKESRTRSARSPLKCARRAS